MAARFNFLLSALLATGSGFAAAKTLELIEGAYEASLTDVAFPQSAYGSILVGLCAGCEQRPVPTDGETRYFSSRGEIPLAAFLAEVGELRLSDESAQQTMVNVYYRLDTGRATRVSLAPL